MTVSLSNKFNGRATRSWIAMVAIQMACLSHRSLAYDKNNRLADYYDKIQIYNSTAPDVEVYSDKLFAFPYVQNF